MAGKKLLVADDSLTIQKVIRLALSNEGYEIQAISDGADAIQHIATFRPDVVLVDVSLPTRTAFEIKRELNTMSDHAATRFILMSSAFEKIDEAQAEEVGFDGHLTKPFDPAHLRQTLTEVLTAPSATPAVETPTVGQPHVELGAAASAAAAAVSPFPADFPPPAKEPEPTSLSIQLDPPAVADFPPSDFELLETTQSRFTHQPVDAPPPLPFEEPLPPDTPAEDTDDELWGKHEETPPPPPERSSRAEPRSEHDEIRELTESTIRMSGLADLSQISAQTPADDFDWRVNEPSLKPPGSLADMGGSTLQPFATPPPAPSLADEIPGLSGMNTMPPMPGMEDAVRLQVQQTLEKMAREILPELAERVIKAEINRLLNEKL